MSVAQGTVGKRRGAGGRSDSLMGRCLPVQSEGRHYPRNVEKINDTFWPPNPKLFDSVVSTLDSRTLFGT